MTGLMREMRPAGWLPALSNVVKLCLWLTHVLLLCIDIFMVCKSLSLVGSQYPW
jgi:hypothetical protein